MADLVVKESVNHYLENGNDLLFGCFLDLSKAYDRVSHPKLFNKLLERRAPPVMVRFLRNWYDQQITYVRWNSSTSTAFKVSIGVREGSVLSPMLFNIYINDLLVQLSLSGAGICVNGQFYGCSAYADDGCLLSASRTGMKHLLQVCEKFAQKNYLKFNSKKSKVCVFIKKRSVLWKETDFYLDGELKDK